MLKHKVHEIKLPSGMQGIIIDTPKTGVVFSEISFRAGEFLLSREKWEAAHLLEHVLLGANKYYARSRDFQAAIEQNGAFSNASTSVYDITYEVESADFEWQRVLGILCDSISTPAFLKEDFDSEQSSVREELTGRSNNHFRHINLGLRQAMDLFALTDPERLDLMDNVNIDDLKSHYKNTHTLPNARFIVAGNFNGNYGEVETLLTERLVLPKSGNRIAMPQEQPKTPKDPFITRKPSVPNIYFFLDSYCPRKFNISEYVMLQIISTLLTETMYSRIFGTAREKGLVYSMSSGSTSLGYSTGWWLGAQVSKSNSAPLMRLIRDQCKLLRDGEIPDQEFEEAKRHYLGKTMLSGQTVAGLVGMYNSYYVDDELDDLNKIQKIIENIKPSDCTKLFLELCDSGSWGIGLLGSTSLVPGRELKSYVSEIFNS